MVQAAENRAELGGVVRRVEPASEAMSITLEVERADTVPGMANLLAGTVGTTITVTLPGNAGDVAPQPGDRIHCQARLAGPGRYVAVRGTLAPG